MITIETYERPVRGTFDEVQVFHCAKGRTLKITTTNPFILDWLGTVTDEVISRLKRSALDRQGIADKMLLMPGAYTIF